MNIVHLFADSFNELNSSIYRTIIPARALLKAGHKVDIRHVYSWTENSPDQVRSIAFADVVIVQRVAIAESLRNVKFWRPLSKTLIIDCDDDYARIGDDNQAHVFWRDGLVEVTVAPGLSYKKPLGYKPIEMLKELVGICNAHTSPGKLLAEDYKKYGNSFWLPNYFDTERWLNVPKLLDPDWITIGYASSMSHLISYRYSGVAEALQRVLQKRKNVRFMLVGDKRLYDELDLPASRKLYRHYVKWDEYPRMISQFDIMIAPLGTQYDHRRSFLKLEEATLMGIPCVATRSVVYEPFEQAGIGTYVSNGDFDGVSKEDRIDEWEVKLLDVIDNLPAYKAKAQNDIAYGMEWDVVYNIPNILSLYEKIANTPPRII